jgi:hypothetical protein
MKRGELIILWIGGLLTMALLLLADVPSGLSVRDSMLRELGLPTSEAASMAAVTASVFKVISRILAVWIICGLVWLTLYRRKRAVKQNP